MDKREWDKRLDEIIDELNALELDRDDLEGDGAFSLEMALDYRADSQYEDCVEPTPDEIEKIKVECERNVKKVVRIDEAKQRLFEEYDELTGTTPHLYDVTNTYARSWHEKFPGNVE